MRIPTAHIESDLKSLERFGAIAELVERLVSAGAVPIRARASILGALSVREEVMSTGFSGLALPHAETDAVSKPITAFGRSRSGLAFDSLDGLPVHFVFLCLIPSARPGSDKRVRFLEEFQGVFSRANLEAITRCSTAEEISAILNGESSQ